MGYEVVTVRCKFRCTEISTIQGWGEHKVLYKAKLAPVGGDSEENKAFYAATPSGFLELATIKTMPFEVGQDYYLDIMPA